MKSKLKINTLFKCNKLHLNKYVLKYSGFIFLFLIIFSFSNKLLSQQYNFLEYTSQNGLASSKTTSLAQDKEGYLWIGTESGLSRFDGTSFTNFDRFDGLSSNHILELNYFENELHIKHPDSVFSTLKNNEIAKGGFFNSLKPTLEKPEIGKMFNEIKIIENLHKLIYPKKIKATLLDKENTLWIATAESGLLGLPLENFPIYSLKNTKNLKSVYKKNETEHLISYSDAIVTLTFKDKKPIYRTIHKSYNKEITCAMSQNNSELWYGTNKGLYLKFTGTSIEYSFKELRNKTINSIEKLSNGDILISADNTLYKYESSTNLISKFVPEMFLTTNSLLNTKGSVFALAKGNVLETNGLNNSLIFPFEKQYNEVEFSHIFIDENKNFWISSIEKGVYFKDNKSGKISHFTKENNLPFKKIHSCFVKENILWMVTNIGLIKHDISTGKHYVFSEKYFNNIEFISGIVQNKEDYYFVSNKGIISVFNTDIHTKSNSSLAIENFLVSGKNRNINSTIELSYQDFPIEINYKSVSLNNKIYYQHILKGQTKDWSNPSLQTKVNYSDLAAGSYEFIVRSFNPINNEILDQKSIFFNIKIPFWKTIKFLYLAFVVIAGIILFFYLTRLIRLRKQKRKLQKLVEEKTYELSVQKQNIEQFSYSLSHDLKNPINNIKGLVEIMDGKTGNNPEILKMLQNSTQNLENKIKTTIKSIKRMQDNKKEIDNLSFETVFTNVKQSLLLLIKQNNVEFFTDFKVENIKYNPSILDSIFYNLISNSIKYKMPERNAKIEISTKKEGNFIILKIKDNGLGFDAKKNKEALFSIFERVHTHKKGSGIGLYMIKQMVELNGGSMDVESQTGIGSTFYVKLKELN